MTVRINKPAFNIREKLKELDFFHLPYQKMPPGSIVQTAYSRSTMTTRGDFTSSAGVSEIHSSLRTSISLRQPGSVVLVSYTVGWRQDGASAYGWILPQVSTDGGSNFSLFTDYTGASNNEMIRNSANDGYTFDTQTISFIDWNTTATDRIYSLFVNSISGTIYIGDNQPRTNMIVQEIAQ